MRRLIVSFLLLCATFHCVLSIFYVNISYLSLEKFSRGLERQPFQRRMLMVPFLRWAAKESWLRELAARWGHFVPQSEPMTAMKLGCIILSFLMLTSFGFWTLRQFDQLRIQTYWLVWALTLVILYVSYGARYEQNLWYPYDLPHLVLFGSAVICILANKPQFYLLFACLDAPMRETAIYVSVLAIAVHFRQAAWRGYIVTSVLAWALVMALSWRLFPNGVHEYNGLRWYGMLKPWHIPQDLSVVGFLWLPVILGRSLLEADERNMLYAASLLMLISAYFATWNETRVWSEWTILFAVLSAREAESYLCKGLSRSGRFGVPSSSA